MFNNLEHFNGRDPKSLLLAIQEMLLYNNYLLYKETLLNEDVGAQIEPIAFLYKYYNLEEKLDNLLPILESLEKFLLDILEMQTKRLDKIKPRIENEKESNEKIEEDEKGINAWYYIHQAPTWILEQGLKVLIEYVFAIEDQRNKEEYYRYIDNEKTSLLANGYGASSYIEQRPKYVGTRFPQWEKEDKKQAPQWIPFSKISKRYCFIPEEVSNN